MDEMRYQLDLLKAMNKKLSGRDKMFRLLCDASNNAFLFYDFETGELEALGKWNDYFDFLAKDVSDISRIADALDEPYDMLAREVLFLEKNGEKSKVVKCLKKDGHTWLEIDTRVEYNESGKPMIKIIFITDVSRIHTQNEELKYLAYYDQTTGLYNRNYFITQLNNMLRKAEDEHSIVSVLFMDIDGFRTINDGSGMLLGDEMVQAYAQYLDTFSGPNVMLCHMNSDVFCMAVYDPRGEYSVERIHSKISERIAQGFILSDGTDVRNTMSIGVAEYPESSRSAIELINCAEIVMYKAKHTQRGGIQYFDAPIIQEFLDTVKLENKLKEAVFNQNFCMYFQPQYFTDSHRFRGVEALIRWKDEGKNISPAIFIPIAEKNGSIIPIGAWVIEESIRIFAGWKKKYDFPMIMSINISAIQYKRRDFVSQIISTIEKYGVNPSEIELEITESILIEDFNEVKEKLITLREYGIRISLDDFGTGFSSLSYLNGLPIDTLKIDKSFVDKLMTENSTKIIVETIIGMVRKLGYESIAEGVEQENQLAYLREIGCDVIQGYLWAKPILAEDVEELLSHF